MDTNDARYAVQILHTGRSGDPCHKFEKGNMDRSRHGSQFFVSDLILVHPKSIKVRDAGEENLIGTRKNMDYGIIMMNEYIHHNSF